MFERIAIMGAGSLGTILGAFIAKNRQIDLIDANKAHVDALNANGAKIIGNADFVQPVRALTPDQMEGEYDLYFYMAKQTYNDACIPQMKKHSNDKTIVCSCQNGLPEMAVVETFGEDRVVGCPIGWGATYTEPGVSNLTSPLEKSSVTLGTVKGPVTPELEAIKEILEYMCPVTLDTNLIGLRWCKVLMNATFSGMSAVMGDSFGAVMDDDIGLTAVAYIGRECIRAVADAGIKMEPFHAPGVEVDFTKYFAFNDEASLAATKEFCKKVWGPHRALHASMLQDLQKGLRCEIDYINGAVCELGKKAGTPTPVNDAVVRVVKEVEAGTRKLSHDNLAEFAFMNELLTK